MDPLEGESPWADTPAQPLPLTSESTAASDDVTNKPSEPTPSNLGASSGSRPSRLTPRRLVAQPTKLQAVEDDPLGPLGGPGGDVAAPLAEGEPPLPPQKELASPTSLSSPLPVRTTMSLGQQTGRKAIADPHRIDDDDEVDEDGGRIGGRAPPPVQAALPLQVDARGMGPPSVSVEQAAKPTFIITVGDPHKVGDLTSSHIVYSVRTKVCRLSP